MNVYIMVLNGQFEDNNRIVDIFKNVEIRKFISGIVMEF